VINDGTNMYEYDAEGRQTGVLNMQNGLTGYVYDAEGRRIEKVQVQGWNTPNPQSVIQNEYLLGLGNEQVTVLDGSGNWQWTNAYAGGKQLATYSGSSTYFAVTDWLGSKRMDLSVTAPSTVSVTQSCTNLPYGDGQNCTGSDVNQLHFTGKERDTESTNDYFGARYYAANLAARWLTPDWSSKVEPVPYAKLDDPQSLNLYAYVGNNPLSDADADGHSCLWCAIMGHDGSWIGNLLRVVFLKNQKQAQENESATASVTAAEGSASNGGLSATARVGTAQASASASYGTNTSVSAKASASFTTTTINEGEHSTTEADTLTANAGAHAGVGLGGKSGVGISAGASANADILSASQTETITLGPVTITGTATGNVGLGANASFSLGTGGISASAGVTPGYGGALSLGISWGGDTVSGGASVNGTINQTTTTINTPEVQPNE